MKHDPWLMDVSCFPQRLDLELSGEALDHLERLSAKTGRSISEVAAVLLAQALTSFPGSEP